jgi:hypothetical protein
MAEDGQSVPLGPPSDTSIQTSGSSAQHEDAKGSQFHKLGEVVEGEDDTGLIQVESLCMNCQENVCQESR